MAATIARNDGLLRGEAAKLVGDTHRMCTHFVERTWCRAPRNSSRLDFETDAPLGEIAEAAYESGGYPIR